VSEWGASVYGDPCRQCGFRWSTGLEGARAGVAGVAAEYRRILAGATGAERHPDAVWSSGEYVCHVADNLRIWAERLVGVAGGGSIRVGRYDENELARVRDYPSISLPAALWTLERAVGDWQDAVDRSGAEGVVLIHPERGEQTLVDVAVSNAHDAEHHRWDIGRSLHG
jgi:DinB superfamily